MPPSSSIRGRMPSLPAGFRFHPTDEELIVHYLMNQAASLPCPVPIIAEVNIYQCNPWDLPPKALFGEKEWYFFSPRDRKYPNGARPNRAAGSGYWKATGTDKAILSTPASESIGVKKALVFYRGKPPRGVKTDWIMHEYRLTAGSGSSNKNSSTKRRGSSSSSSSSSSSMRLDDWVLCRIHKKSNNFQFYSDHQETEEGSTVEEEEEDTCLRNSNDMSGRRVPSPKSEEEAAHDGLHQFQFPPLSMTKSCSLTDLLATVDYSTLSQLLLDAPPPAEITDEPQQQQSPLIYTTTTPAACHPPLINLNDNNTSMVNTAMAQGDALPCSDYGAGYSSLKRKRVVMTLDLDGAATFDDGSWSSKKKPQLPCSDSRSSSFFGGYCNPQLAEAGTSSSSVHQYSGLLPSHQQLLMNNHLRMQ